MKQVISNDELISQIQQTQDFINQTVMKEDMVKAGRHLEKLREIFLDRARTQILEGWEEE